MKWEQEGGGKNINYVTIEGRKCRKKQKGRIPVQNDGEGRKKNKIFSEKREESTGAVSTNVIQLRPLSLRASSQTGAAIRFFKGF